MAARRGEGVWMFIHRYLGLAVGLWLCAIGASGAVIAFYRQLEHFLDPRLFLTETAGLQHPDLDRMHKNVQAAFPDRFILLLHRHAIRPDESYPFLLSAPLPRLPDGKLDLSSIGNFDAAVDWRVFVDPRSGEIIADASYWTVINLLRDFHRDLFEPPSRRKILGVIALSLFLTTIGGIVLWWRDGRKNITRALTIRASAPLPRLIRDSHTVFGMYAAILIAWLALSAAAVCYNAAIRGVADWALRGGKPAQTFETATIARETTPPDAPLISFNAARDIALTDHPQSDIGYIRFPKHAADMVTFRMVPLDEPRSLYTRFVFVGAGSGQILGRFDPSRQNVTDNFGLWFITAHNGTLFGDYGPLVNLLGGIVLASLFPTGIYLWLKKRPSRVKKRDAPAAAVASPAE